MLTALLPLVLFAVDLTGAPAALAPAVVVAPTVAPRTEIDESGAPFLVAQALVDADRLVDVHEAAGVIVFDLDRADERFQLTVTLDDDGAVVASTIDWVGPADPNSGTIAASIGELRSVDRIDWEPGRRVLVLRGAGDARRLVLEAQT